MSANICTAHEALATPVHAEDAYWGGFYIFGTVARGEGAAVGVSSIGVLCGVNNYWRAVDMAQHGERFSAAPESYGIVDLRECGRCAHGLGRLITTTMVRVYAFAESCARRLERGEDIEHEFIRWRVTGERPRRALTCTDTPRFETLQAQWAPPVNYPGFHWGDPDAPTMASAHDDDDDVAAAQMRGHALQSVRAMQREDAQRNLRAEPAGRAGVPPRQGGAREGASHLEKLRAAQPRSGAPARWLAADWPGEGCSEPDSDTCVGPFAFCAHCGRPTADRGAG